jgi:threonine dehydratase
LFEYVSATTARPASRWSGSSIGRPAIWRLLARMDAAPLDIERIKPDSAEFRYLI